MIETNKIETNYLRRDSVFSHSNSYSRSHYYSKFVSFFKLYISVKHGMRQSVYSGKRLPEALGNYQLLYQDTRLDFEHYLCLKWLA